MKTLMRRVVAVLGLAALVSAGSLTLVAQQAQQAWPTVANREMRPPQSWEDDIKKFEAAEQDYAASAERHRFHRIVEHRPMGPEEASPSLVRRRSTAALAAR